MPQASPVKRFAASRGIPVLQPATLKGNEAIEQVRALQADAIVVAAYGLILPRALLDASRCGALNVHASLLPRWRGAAPIQRAILAGDGETGISIMQMDAGLDTGPVLMQKRIPIATDDDSASLHEKLADLGSQLIVAALRDVEAGRARAVPQPAQGVTYAGKIEKRDAHLDWSRPAAELERAIRALRPAPGAFGLLEGHPVKLWRASVVEATGEPGAVLECRGNLVIAAGKDAIAVAQLQRAGGRALSTAEFLRGHPLAPGTRFA